jgi:paraquat-inducible protein A
MQHNTSNQSFLFFISLLAFGGALYLPLFTVTGDILGFKISEEQITFFKSIAILEEQNFKELALLLYAFVIVLPVIKFITILFNIYGIRVLSPSINNFLLSLQKYAMVDVFVIAIIAVASKSNPMFSIQLQAGAYAMILSVLSGIFLSIWVQNNKYSMGCLM